MVLALTNWAGPDASAQHAFLLPPPPSSALNAARLTPDLYPALPTLNRKEVMHLLSLIIYLFGETEMM